MKNYCFNHIVILPIILHLACFLPTLLASSSSNALLSRSRLETNENDSHMNIFGICHRKKLQLSTGSNFLKQKKSSLFDTRKYTESSILDELRGGSSVVDDDKDDEEEYDIEDYEDEEVLNEESTDAETDNDASEYEEEEEENQYSEYESEEEYDADEAIVEEASDDDAVEVSGSSEIEYDSVLLPSSMQSMGMTLGVMILLRKVDLTDTKIVQYGRFAFLAYIISTQIFFMYVRIQAKRAGNKTQITLSNPLASLVKSQVDNALKGDTMSNAGKMLGDNDNGNIAKSLTNKFLSSTTTVMEYDISQSKKQSGGMLFNLAFMWFLHFKMNQVQPLFYQTASGLLNFVYSPLFQVYVLGRNLERPFVTPKPENPFMAQEEAVDEESIKEEEGEGEEEEENEDGTGDIDDGDSSAESENDAEDEYDSE